MTSSAAPSTPSDPVVIVGWRENGSLQARRLKLRRDVFPPLLQIAADAEAVAAAVTQRSYDPNGELERQEEAFVISLASAQSEPAVTRLEGTPEDDRQLGELVSLVRGADRLDELDARQLSHGKFLFYAVVTVVGAERVGYVKKIDPTLIARRGVLAFQYADTLVTIAQPDLALELDVDLIVRQDTIVAFSKFAVDQLLADLGVALRAVPAQTSQVITRLSTVMAVAEGSSDALRAYVQSRPSMARRLARLVSRLASVALTTDMIGESLDSHGENRNRLLDAAGALRLTPENIADFLDVIEGRWFEDDLTGERRRADRFSTRRTKS